MQPVGCTGGSPAGKGLTALPVGMAARDARTIDAPRLVNPMTEHAHRNTSRLWSTALGTAVLFGGMLAAAAPASAFVGPPDEECVGTWTLFGGAWVCCDGADPGGYELVCDQAGGFGFVNAVYRPIADALDGAGRPIFDAFVPSWLAEPVETFGFDVNLPNGQTVSVWDGGRCTYIRTQDTSGANVAFCDGPLS